MKDITAKVLVLGAQGVGKSSLAHRLVHKTFDQQVTPTIGVSYFQTDVEIGDHNIKLQFWDTAGQERFRAMIPMYYRNCAAALLVYDVTDVESFQAARKWEEELRRYDNINMVLYVIGNKYDIAPNQRKVNQLSADTFANEIGGHFREVSALSNHGINEMFVDLCVKLVHRDQTCTLYSNKQDIFDQVNLQKINNEPKLSCCR